MNPSDLAACMGATEVRAEPYAAPATYAMATYGIDSPARVAAFLAQCGHETGGLKWMAEIWGPTPAQKGYEMRKDLGNTQPGDGERYKGRGWIQITGRANYQAVSNALCIDLIANPVNLETPDFAPVSAAWWWQHHGLNELADKGDFLTITKRINGGTNGLDDRMARWATAKAHLGIA